MFDLDNFSQAVAGIYDASIDVDRWIDALSLLARIFDSRGAQIGVASALDQISFLKIWGWTDEELAPLMPRYVALTPADPRAGMLRVPYKPTHCRQFVSDEDFRTSEMYKQALAPAGMEYSMGVYVPIEEKLMSVVSVIRGPDGARLHCCRLRGIQPSRPPSHPRSEHAWRISALSRRAC